MSKTTMIHARLPLDLKEDVAAILKQLGLSATEAITLFYSQVRLHKGIPFDVKIPNKTTIKAMQEADEGKTINFDSFDKMMQHLNDENE
ncbi:MAG: type II toxin-antitoxin system RelB/DinJ family antitoxin [Candidatus Riflebacteria bacterium]|nr:type II toxin-antitoxin system RelB/DinJ family antitoxin [Candidatus Riflebacteria bacterium]